LQLGGLRKIRKIKSLDDVLFQLFPLCRSVGRDKNGIRGDRTPEVLVSKEMMESASSR